jgi:hypothetical protein
VLKQISTKLKIVVLGILLLGLLLPFGAEADPLAEYSEKERKLSQKAAEVDSLKGQVG